MTAAEVLKKRPVQLDLTAAIANIRRERAPGRVFHFEHGLELGIKGSLCEMFIPWHQRIIAAAHTHGKLGLFHVCGQVEAIMDDLIDTVGIDAKHSTQDVIEPMVITKQRWGDRVGLLGGVDVDFITRTRPDRMRSYTRNILDTCTAGGGFALGVGNWVADSIPIENYLSMLSEARCYP